MSTAQAWILSPSRHGSCVLGRLPPPKERDADAKAPKFCASLYSMGKNGVKTLDYGPKAGQTRKDALSKLLRLVEIRIGEMMMGDEDEAKERERDRRQ